MPDQALSLVLGAAGGFLAALIQYAFGRFAETQRLRREIVETTLLQLQNSVESLYYRANNLLDWSGKSVMSDEYFTQTTVFVLGKVLGYEDLLVDQGVYAKLHRNLVLKRQVKAKLHEINWAMDDRAFLHYHRVQLGEMLQNEKGIISYTQFLERWGMPQYQLVVASASNFIEAVSEGRQERLETIRRTAGELVNLLSDQTKVPSALSLLEQKGSSAGSPTR